MNKIKITELENIYKKVFGFNKSDTKKIMKLRLVSNKDFFYLFAQKVEELYQDKLANLLDKILIDKKTIKQHMFNNNITIEELFNMFELASKSKIKIKKTIVSEEKTILRLSGIGRIS
jgi:hypothetical protein